MPSALGNVIAAVVSTLRASGGLAGVVVDDEGEPSNRAWSDGILIGDDGDPETDIVSVFQQEWANLSHTKRYERGEIPCAAVSQSGSTAIADCRTRAFELIGLCETALLTNPTLGGLVFSIELFTTASSKPIQDTRGSAVVAPFVIRYWTQV
jgi:hypothetical protein